MESKALKTHLESKRYHSSNGDVLSYHDDEMDFKEIFMTLWAGKKLIVFITLVFIVISSIWAVTQPNIYKASIVLMPSSDESGASGLSKLAGQFGGIASLAGIDLNGTGSDKTVLAIEVLKSRRFIDEFINNNGLAVPLIAGIGWDLKLNKVIVDKDVYDATTDKWIRDVSFPQTVEPSSWELYEALMDILSVSQDIDTGIVTISIEYFDPNLAKLWLESLVKQINEDIRKKDRNKASDSIEFLTHKLQQTELSDMKVVFYQLIEEQTKTIMLAEVSEEYVFEVIDPASVPDEKIKPRRGIIVLLSGMLGVTIAFCFIVIRRTITKGKKDRIEND